MDNRLYERNFLIHRDFYPHVKEFASTADGDVLDIGCGQRRFSDWFSGCNYVGLDFDPKFGDPDVIGDGLKLPFQSNSFDYCVSTQVLEHLKNPFEFFTEIERVLKPGGTCCVTTNQMYPLHMEPHDYFRFTQYGLREVISDTKLEVVDDFQAGSLATRVCSELNYITDAALPSPLSSLGIAALNTACYPFRNIEFRRDPVLVGAIAKLPREMHQ